MVTTDANSIIFGTPVLLPCTLQLSTEGPSRASVGLAALSSTCKVSAENEAVIPMDPVVGPMVGITVLSLGELDQQGRSSSVGCIILRHTVIKIAERKQPGIGSSSMLWHKRHTNHTSDNSSCTKNRSNRSTITEGGASITKSPLPPCRAVHSRLVRPPIPRFPPICGRPGPDSHSGGAGFVFAVVTHFIDTGISFDRMSNILYVTFGRCSLALPSRRPDYMSFVELLPGCCPVRVVDTIGIARDINVSVTPVLGLGRHLFAPGEAEERGVHTVFSENNNINALVFQYHSSSGWYFKRCGLHACEKSEPCGDYYYCSYLYWQDWYSITAATTAGWTVVIPAPTSADTEHHLSRHSPSPHPLGMMAESHIFFNAGAAIKRFKETSDGHEILVQDSQQK